METPLNTLSLAHQFISSHVRPGDLCIDATVGRGGDTLFLCELTGPTGHVIGFDIQADALSQAETKLNQTGCKADLHLESHAAMASYAAPGTVSAIMFNFGYLPGGDHSIYTHAESSIAAINAGLTLLKPNGVMSLCIYHGGANGNDERDALLQYFETVDSKQFTVLITRFSNRPNNPPIPVFILKRT